MRGLEGQETSAPSLERPEKNVKVWRHCGTKIKCLSWEFGVICEQEMRAGK